ncbi:MAG: C-terminal binding protein [Granulosicoccus sp.]|nr:C-terminal binding protein [Granulosicoccus sp.]
MRIVRTDAEIQCPEIDDALQSTGAELVLLPGDVSESSLCEAVREASLLLMCYTPITAAVIQGTTRLKGIVKYGVGIDAIDIEAATAHGIPVVNVPDYADNTVAEGAFCLMLSLVKHLIPIHQAVQDSGWIEPQSRWLGNDIQDKCVAIIGVGRIGRAFARMAGAGFGARVIGFDPHVSAALMQANGIEKCDELAALLHQADVVSLHTVLNDSTRSMIAEAEFRAMHRRPVLINVSRGALVDEPALLRALDSGQIRAAGLDVYAQEPLKREGHDLSDLYGRDNVILCPHLSFYTHEAMRRLSTETLARCREILSDAAVTIHSTDPRLLAQQGVLNIRLDPD